MWPLWVPPNLEDPHFELKPTGIMTCHAFFHIWILFETMRFFEFPGPLKSGILPSLGGPRWAYTNRDFENARLFRHFHILEFVWNLENPYW